MKTNIITISSPEGITHLTTDSSSNPVLKKEGAKDRVLLNEATTSFDAHCFKDGSLHVFLTTAGGSLLYIKCTQQDSRVKPVMLAKDSNNKICFVRTLNINGKFHLFYCLDSENKYLVHQVFAEGEVYEPEVIDVIGKRFVYDAVTDDYMNIHIIYAAPGGELKYRKYINSQKALTEPAKICSCDPRCICVCHQKDRLFASYTQMDSGNYNVYLLSVLDSTVKKAVFSVGSHTELALNSKEGELILHLVDCGVCYEIKSDLDLNISKGSPVGKSNGIFGVRSSDTENTVSRYPVGRDCIPFSGYSDFKRIKTLSDQLAKPKGADVQNFAKKYKDAFDEKIAQLQEEEFFWSFARIEASLGKLVEIAEKVLEEMQKQ